MVYHTSTHHVIVIVTVHGVYFLKSDRSPPRAQRLVRCSGRTDIDVKHGLNPRTRRSNHAYSVRINSGEFSREDEYV